MEQTLAHAVGPKSNRAMRLAMCWGAGEGVMAAFGAPRGLGMSHCAESAAEPARCRERQAVAPVQSTRERIGRALVDAVPPTATPIRGDGEPGALRGKPRRGDEDGKSSSRLRPCRLVGAPLRVFLDTRAFEWMVPGSGGEEGRDGSRQRRQDAPVGGQ